MNSKLQLEQFPCGPNYYRSYRGIFYKYDDGQWTLSSNQNNSSAELVVQVSADYYRIDEAINYFIQLK